LMKEAREESIALIVMDIPLLYESKLEYMVEKVVVVYCTAEQQLKRLMERNGYDEEEAMRRIASQMSIEEKKSRADYVIDNSGTFTETEEQVDELVGKLLDKGRRGA